MSIHFSPHKQRGLGIATALFVITVMALLAVLVFQLVRNNSQTTQEAILLNRAFQAAQSGVQFGLNAVFPPNPAATSSCPGIAMSTTYELAEAGLNACTAEVTCSSIDVGAADYVTIESTGTCGGVSRTVQVRAQ